MSTTEIKRGRDPAPQGGEVKPAVGRGRPRRIDGAPVKWQVVLSQQEADLIRGMADREHLSIAAWLRRAAMQDAERRERMDTIERVRQEGIAEARAAIQQGFTAPWGDAAPLCLDWDATLKRLGVDTDETSDEDLKWLGREYARAFRETIDAEAPQHACGEWNEIGRCSQCGVREVDTIEQDT